MPSAAVKFPSEPPPTVHSPSETLLWCETRVRGAALNHQFGFANSFARRLQQAARAEGRLKDKNGIAAPRFRFEEFARRFASDLLVRSPDKDETFAKWHSRLLKCY